jgi:hypothetical protein
VAEIFPNMGHDMVLEPGWAALAERILHGSKRGIGDSTTTERVSNSPASRPAGGPIGATSCMPNHSPANSHLLNTRHYQLKVASCIAVQLLSAVLFRDSYALASSTGRVRRFSFLDSRNEEHRQRGHPFDTGLGEPRHDDDSNMAGLAVGPARTNTEPRAG